MKVQKTKQTINSIIYKNVHITSARLLFSFPILLHTQLSFQKEHICKCQILKVAYRLDNVQPNISRISLSKKLKPVIYRLMNKDTLVNKQVAVI